MLQLKIALNFESLNQDPEAETVMFFVFRYGKERPPPEQMRETKY